MELGLKNTHVLVTGASGGIGSATVRLFLEQGANVTAHYHSSATSLQPLVEKYGAARIRTAKADLTSEIEAAALVVAAETAGWGPVSAIVIGHGIFDPRPVPIVRMELAQWNTSLSANLTSCFLVAREFLRGLERAGAAMPQNPSIVFLTSTAATLGIAGFADYAVCKAAMQHGLALSLKNEIVKIAPQGRVNCISPGWTRSPAIAGLFQNPMNIYFDLATMPLKKIAEPEDIASQIVLVSSSRVSGHVTGQAIMVAGGIEGRVVNMPSDIPSTL